MPRVSMSQDAALYASVISNSSVAGRGVSCKFYFMGGNVGLKVYTNRRVRDNNFFVQNLLWSKGLAPKAHKRLNIGKRQYGFTTELCEVAKGYEEQKHKIWAYGSYYHFKQFNYWDKWYAAGAKLVQDTIAAFHDVLEVSDTHEGNFGINYQTSEMNIIDVGHFRVYDTVNPKAHPWASNRRYRVEQCPTKLLCDIVFHGMGVDMRKL